MWDNPMQKGDLHGLPKKGYSTYTKWDERLLASVVPQEEFAKVVSVTSNSLGFIVDTT